VSAKYRTASDVPTDVICTRLNELAYALTHRDKCNWQSEFTLRVPAEFDRDADIVMSIAAERLKADAVRIAELEAALADSHAVVVRQAVAACMALGLPSNPVRVHPLLVKDAEVES